MQTKNSIKKIKELKQAPILKQTKQVARDMSLSCTSQTSPHGAMLIIKYQGSRLS